MEKTKVKKIRNAEYYNSNSVFDNLFERSSKNENFNKLMRLIISEENILLAYRNIKSNKGSTTPGVDGKTIEDIGSLEQEQFIKIIRDKFKNYISKPIKRVEIPKPDGKTRPLGIPCIVDRIAQQCILQVLDPIAEAKFYDRSYGFRPNRSAEHAIAETYKMIQNSNLYYIVNVDIKSFFENVDHKKLIRQIWTMGIHDKQLIKIIQNMLKAPIVLPDGTKIYPNKGTPQGGILSPLLSNIVLNELDWWISSQWENFPTRKKYQTRRNGVDVGDKSNQYKMMRKNSNLKEMYIVRYADDFKIFCRNKDVAERTFIAVTKWLKERLKLEVSEEKSSIVDVRKKSIDFLGFEIGTIRRRNSYVIKSHICQKAKERIKIDLADTLKDLAHVSGASNEYVILTRYNAKVIGIQEYYSLASKVCEDLAKIAYKLRFLIHTKSPSARWNSRYKRKGIIEETYLKQRYGNSRQVRFINGHAIAPIAYVQWRMPRFKDRTINKYTVDGRKKIHDNLTIATSQLKQLLKSVDKHQSVEFSDNRIAKYIAQHGKCAVLGNDLLISEMHCHHITPRALGGGDEYNNLMIIHEEVHILIHSTKQETIEQYLKVLNLNKKQLNKVNELRIKAQLKPIQVS